MNSYGEVDDLEKRSVSFICNIDPDACMDVQMRDPETSLQGWFRRG